MSAKGETMNDPFYSPKQDRHLRLVPEEDLLLAKKRIAALEAQVQTLQIALAESVKLQSHYAELINMHDGGKRRLFKDSDEWIARLIEIGTLAATEPVRCTCPPGESMHTQGCPMINEDLQERGEKIAQAEYRPHRFGDQAAWFAASVRLGERIATLEAHNQQLRAALDAPVSEDEVHDAKQTAMFYSERALGFDAVLTNFINRRAALAAREPNKCESK